jgi:hypothetical protein
MTTPDREAGRGSMERAPETAAVPSAPWRMERGQGSAQGGTAREQLREAKDQVVRETRQALQQARDRAGSSLAESKGQLADQVESLATVFRRTADELRGEDRRTMASITNAVARQADQAGNYLRRIDARAVREDLEDITRRRPALVLGGAAALGLIAARFFKSSEGGDREREHRAAEQERPSSDPSRPAIDVSSTSPGLGTGYPAPGPGHSPPAYPPGDTGKGPGGPYGAA